VQGGYGAFFAVMAELDELTGCRGTILGGSMNLSVLQSRKRALAQCRDVNQIEAKK